MPPNVLSVTFLAVMAGAVGCFLAAYRLRRTTPMFWLRISTDTAYSSRPVRRLRPSRRAVEDVRAHRSTLLSTIEGAW